MGRNRRRSRINRRYGPETTKGEPQWNSDLTEAQKARAQECKTPEELVALAKEEGVELTDAQLEAVAGGDAWGLVCSMREHERRIGFRKD